MDVHTVSTVQCRLEETSPCRESTLARPLARVQQAQGSRLAARVGRPLCCPVVKSVKVAKRNGKGAPAPASAQRCLCPPSTLAGSPCQLHLGCRGGTYRPTHLRYHSLLEAPLQLLHHTPLLSVLTAAALHCNGAGEKKWPLAHGPVLDRSLDHSSITPRQAVGGGGRDVNSDDYLP